MKWRIVILNAILISVSQIFPAFSQAPTILKTQALQMIPEPLVTMGTSNIVFTTPDSGAKTFLFKELAASDYDTLASTGNPGQFSATIGGLADGKTYQYQVLFEGLSNIVSSTQDNTTPIVIILFDGNFANSSSFAIPFSVVDSVSQSIKKTVFYYRPLHNSNEDWRQVDSTEYSPPVVASPGNPFSDSFTFLVPDSLGDGEYEFLIIAQYTAWARDHRPDQPFAGEEGNMITVSAATPALKQLFVDTFKPSSQITSSLNQFFKSVSVQIQYHVDDIFVGHDDYQGSGANKIRLLVNYKVTPNGSYTYKDSLFQTVQLPTLPLELDGAFNFVAGQDGFYEFYTIVSDTAQNVENDGLPKQTNLPFVKIDTSLPEVDSIAISEMSDPGDPKTVAKPGWTKKTTVSYQIFGAGDVSKDGYQSGLETIRLAEDSGFIVNDSSFSFETGALSGLYELSNPIGSKEVFVSVTDSAANSSFPKSDSILFDPNPPLLIQFDIPLFLTAVTNIDANIEASDDFTLDTLYIWRNDTLIIRTALPEDNQFISPLNLEIPNQLGVHQFRAQVRDKAGNLSNAITDSVKLVNVVNLLQMDISDLTDPDDDYLGALTGFSDSMVVSVELTYTSTLRKLHLANDASFSSFTQLVAPWNVISVAGTDTTIQFEYNFSGDDGLKTLFIRGIGPQDTDTSNVVIDSIIIDTVEPVLNQISVYRVLSPGDTTYSYSNSRNIRVRLNTPETEIVKMVFWETGLDSVLYEGFATDTTYSLQILDDGQIELNASIRDQAGNWSVIQNTDAFFDRRLPKLNALSFDSPFSSEFQVNINYDAEDDTAFSGVGLLDRIRFSEDNQFPANNVQVFDLPNLVKNADSFQIDLSQVLGEHTVFAQVRDRAGNWGNILNTSIIVVNIVQPDNLVLEDVTTQTNIQDAAQQGWSNSDTVRAILTHTGVLERIVAAKDSEFLDGKQDYDAWTVIDDSTVSILYDFGDESGLTDLYVKLIGPNEIDTSKVITASIEIDKVRPILDNISFYRVLSDGDSTFLYTNSRDINVLLNTPESGIAKAQIWESGLDSVLYNAFSNDTTYFLKTTTDGQIELNGRIRDKAGNWSLPQNMDVFLDRQLSFLNSLSFDSPFSSEFQVNINFNAADDTTISKVVFLDRIRFSEDIQFPAENVQVFMLPEVTEITDSFQIDLLPNLGEHTVFAQVRDKAGNWGNVLNAQITVIEIVQPTNLVLEDITPQTDMQNAAHPGWSDNDTIRAVLTFDGVLKRIVTGSDLDFSVDKMEFDDWTTINDSTVSFVLAFNNANGKTNLYVKLIGPNISDTSNVINASIFVDKEKPTLDQVILFQAITVSDTIYEFVNDTTVQIRFDNQSEPISAALLREQGSEAIFYSTFQTITNYTFNTALNEVKAVFASVRDSSGNWSVEYSDSIILDTSPPGISRFILSDVSTIGTGDSTLTDDLTIEVTFSTNDILPGKLFRVTIAQNDAFTNNSQSFNFFMDRIDHSNGQFSFPYETQEQFITGNRINCWIVVEDSARNFSAVLNDVILFSAPLRIHSVLFDVDDPTDSLFSSSNTITLQINETSGIFQEVAFSESVAGLTNWTPVQTGEIFITQYEFISAESFFEGKLYVAARNSAGQFKLDSTSIIIDKLIPQLIRIEIKANVPEEATSFTNREDVTVNIQATDLGLVKEIQITQDSTFSTFERYDVSSLNTGDYNASVQFDLTGGNGIKRIFVRVLDQAENVSLISSDEIIVDLDPLGLISNYPNPFNPNSEVTTLVIKSDGATEIELKIYDLFGNLVRELNAPTGIAYNQIVWDGRNGKGEMVANGGYICVVKVGKEVRMRKIAVMK